MIAILTLISWALVIGLAIPALVFCAEVLAGCVGLGRIVFASGARGAAGPGGGTFAGRLVVLMPAHQEAGGLASILARLGGVMPQQAELVVVADNCTDATADLARSAGATVVERNDPHHRGKGFALDAGRAMLAARPTPPDTVIVLDADCVVEDGALTKLALAAGRAGAPVQGRYLMRPCPKAAAAVQISGFAFWLKNDVRLRGASVLGTPAVLTGSGMAFPWPVFASAPLASANIVEDLALGVALAHAGSPPMFLPEATIWSAPAESSATSTQRLRWERGFLATARAEALPLILAGVRRKRPGLIGLGLHLATPPLILLLGLMLIGGLATMGCAWAGAGVFPTMILAGLIGLVLFSIALAWCLGGRPWLSAGVLAALPFYLLLKFRVYVRMIRGDGKTWVRTNRETNDRDAIKGRQKGDE